MLQPGCGRVRPPSLTGLLCGCGDVGGCGAAKERRAAGRRRLGSPGPGPGRRPWREITVFTQAGAGPLGAGHCGRATVFAGSRADPLREWRAQRLTYLSGVAWFPPPAPSPPYPRRCGSGVGCTNPLREPGLAAEWGGLLQQSGRPTYFRGGGVATQSLPYFSRISLWPEELARLCAGDRVGGVSSSDSRRDLIRRAVLEAGGLSGGEGEGAPGGVAESYRICFEQRRLEERATAGGRRTWGAAWAVSAGWDGGTCRRKDWGPWPETLSAGGALDQGYSWGSGEAAQRQGQAEIGPRDRDDLSLQTSVQLPGERVGGGVCCK